MAEVKGKQTLNDTLKEVQQEIFKNINCVKIGRIMDFDPESKMATVAINFENVENEKDVDIYKNESYTTSPYVEDLPVIGNCFHQPIIPGMSVLCLFNDKNIDKWYYNDTTTQPINDRKHDLSDGFILCGLDNVINNSFAKPYWWEPVPNLPKVCDCPIPHWGYDNDHARLRYESGDVSVGGDGVTICGRDYMDVKIFSEGGMVGVYPMGNFEVNNSKGRFIAHGQGYSWFDFEKPEGKFTMYNEFYKKPNKDDPTAPDFILSDMYRILRQAKAVMGLMIEALVLHDGELGNPAAAEIAAATAGLLDFAYRVDSLFVPGDGQIIEEIVEEGTPGV